MHVFIIGAPAAGKWPLVSEELSKLSGATLLNHQPIDFALEIYQDFTEEMWEFVRMLTFLFLERARHHRSVILTGVTDFQNQYHLMVGKNIQGLLNEYHQESLCWIRNVLEERLRRNRTENRLKYKPLKRNFEVSERNLCNRIKQINLIFSSRVVFTTTWKLIIRICLQKKSQSRFKKMSIERDKHIPKELSPKYNPARGRGWSLPKMAWWRCFKPVW